jgi:hypothetical protein
MTHVHEQQRDRHVVQSQTHIYSGITCQLPAEEELGTEGRAAWPPHLGFWLLQEHLADFSPALARPLTCSRYRVLLGESPLQEPPDCIDVIHAPGLKHLSDRQTDIWQSCRHTYTHVIHVDYLLHVLR